MAESRQRGSVKRRTNPKTGKPYKTWTVKYHYYDENNERQQVTKGGFATKALAQTYLTARLEEINNKSYVPTSKQTVADYLDHWFKTHVEINTSEKTQDGYRYIIESHIKPALGHLELQSLNVAHMQKYFTGKSKNGRLDGKEGGLSNQTLVHHHRVLSEALLHARTWGFVSNSVMDLIKAPSVEEKEMVALSFDQVDILIEAADLDRSTAISLVAYNALYYIAVNTGLRRGEILALRWSDIDLDNKNLSVKRTLQRIDGKGLIFKEPKTKKSRRTIKLETEVVDYLRRIKIKQREWKLSLGPIYEDQDLVLAQSNGAPVEGTEAVRVFRRVVNLANQIISERKNTRPDFDISFIPDNLRIHDLRHTYATNALKSGVPLKVVSEMLGHSNINITANTYMHVNQDMQEEAVNKIEEYKKRANKKTL